MDSDHPELTVNTKHILDAWLAGREGVGKKGHLYLEPSCAITSLTIVTTSVTDFAR